MSGLWNWIQEKPWGWAKKNPGKALAITAAVTGSAGLSIPTWVPQVFNILVGGGS